MNFHDNKDMFLDPFSLPRKLKWVLIPRSVELGLEWRVMTSAVFEFVPTVCFLFRDMIHIIGTIYVELERTL